MFIDSADVPARTSTQYPDCFRPWVSGRAKQALGDATGLKKLGVNLVTLEPGSYSALRHWHQMQDEFVYVLSGELTLVTDAGEQILKPGMAAGFPASEADGHHLINRSDSVATYLEVGDRTPDEVVTYPDVGRWEFTHKDGTQY
jgi:uncharacterized cupin superfamily protein